MPSIEEIWPELATPTPMMTVHALMHAVQQRGKKALLEPKNQERLARCNPAARAHLDAFIKRMEAGR
jgi:hypothetical protein